MYNGNSQGLQPLNRAHVVLIPKINEPEQVKDYRPISLTHSFAKLWSKLLANRLTTKINEIIPSNQSAFIRKRCIQDNFVYVQKTIQKFHNTRQKAVFIKLDISKAFDSVNWAYLLDVL